MEDEELRRRLRETVDGFGAPAPGWRQRVMAALPDRDRHPERRRHWMLSAATTAVAVGLVAALVVTLQAVKQSGQPAGSAPPRITNEPPKPTAPAFGPGLRVNAPMAYDADRRLLMIARQFPGDGNWTWDGHAWTRLQAVTGPEPQGIGQMAYDPGRHQGVLFHPVAGADPSGKKVFGSETWIWDGAAWTLQKPDASPSPRGSYGMVFDPATRSVLLFGGSDASGGPKLLSDTWLWDGKTWVLQRPPVSPAPRIGAALGSAFGKVVLFGGLAESSTQLDDTWTWDGKTWTQERPAQSPPARQWASLAETPLRSAVLYGGLNAQGILNDTWVWDGKNWARGNPKGPAPPARYNAAIAYDPAIGKTVLLGGQTLSGALDDLWLFDGRFWIKPAP